MACMGPHVSGAHHAAGFLYAACCCAACGSGWWAAAGQAWRGGPAGCNCRRRCTACIPASPRARRPSKGSSSGRPCHPTPAASRRSATGASRSLWGGGGGGGQAGRRAEGEQGWWACRPHQRLPLHLHTIRARCVSSPMPIPTRQPAECRATSNATRPCVGIIGDAQASK